MDKFCMDEFFDKFYEMKCAEKGRVCKVLKAPGVALLGTGLITPVFSHILVLAPCIFITPFKQENHEFK